MLSTRLHANGIMASGSIVPRKQVGHMLHQPALQRRSKNPLPMEAQGRFDRSLAQGFGPDRGIESRAAEPRRGMPDARL